MSRTEARQQVAAPRNAPRVRNPWLLTGFLLAPIAVVGGLVWWIVATLGADPVMSAEARGPGARDTGGANALGEWLRGRDPNEIEARNRALRSGAAVHPSDIDGAVVLIAVPPTADSDRVGAGGGVFLALENRGEGERLVRLSASPDGMWSATVDGRSLYPLDRVSLVWGDERTSSVALPLIPAEEARDGVPRVVLSWEE